MDFFYGRMSGNSLRSAFALAEAGVQYQPRLVDTKAGEQASAAYRAVNPMGKIPSLVDGSVRLWESNAINWYLAEKFPQAKLLPASLEGRASMLRWLLFQSAHVSLAAVSLFRFTNARVQQFWQFKGGQAGAEAGRKELARYLPVLEQQLEGRDWLETDFTLADVAYAPHFALIAEGGFDFAPYPLTAAWLKRLLARPAWEKAAALVLVAAT